MNKEQPPVTESELARVLELDAKATRGWITVNHETFHSGMGCTPDGCPGHDTGVAFAVEGPVCDPECDGPEEEGEEADRRHWAQCDADSKLVVEYRTLCPRIARELAAARAAIKAVRAQVESAKAALGEHPASDVDLAQRISELRDQARKPFHESTASMQEKDRLRAQVETLTRERDDARAEADFRSGQILALRGQVDSLRAQLAASEADRERLDWIENEAGRAWPFGNQLDVKFTCLAKEPFKERPTLRAAIDAARKEEAK